MKRNMFFLLGMLSLSTLLAKNIEGNGPKRFGFFSGQVKDDFTGADLPAFITLMKSDSAVVDTMTATFASEFDDAGYYFADKPIEKGIYIVKASLDGYDDVCVEKNIRFVARNIGFVFPLIKMHRRMDSYMHELNEVKVTGTLVKLVHKGDTLIYNAQAFKVPEGSMLDGLIRQLPGAELKTNGDILVNGRKIDNLTLNGDDFFKGNNSVMLQNLPYYTVNQVKVYNKKTERSIKVGHDIEPREYTMDIVLKKEYNRGYLTNLQAGAGTHSRYSGRAFMLGYDDLSRIAFYGNTNNLNQNPSPGDQGDWTPEDMGDGENSIKKIGLDVKTRDKEEKLENHLTSDFSWKKSKVKSERYAQQFVQSGDIYSEQINDLTNRSMSWNLHNEMTLKKNLTWDFNTGYLTKSVDELSKDSTFTLESKINSTSSNVWNKYRSYSISTKLDYYLPLSWGDGVGLNAHGGYGTERVEDWSDKNIHYYRAATNNNQLLTGNNPRSNYNFGGGINYSLSFAQGWNVTPSVSFEQILHCYSSEYQENEHTHPSSYTSDLLARTSNSSLSLIYLKDQGKVIWNSTISMSRKYENFKTYAQNDNSEHSRHTWLPSATSSFVYQGDVCFYGTYNFIVSAPQMRMMYGPVSTIDPMVTVYRADGLRNSVTNSFNGNMNHDFKWHNLNLAGNLSWKSTHGKVSYMKATDLSTGHYEYMPGNVDGNWDYSFSVYANMNLDKQGLFNLTSNTAHQYIHDVDFDISTTGLSDQLSKVNHNAISQLLKLTYKKNEFQLGINGSVMADHITSNRHDFNKFTYYKFNYGFNLYTPLPWKFNLTTDFSVYSKRGYSVESMNKDDLVWNASLSHFLFKKKLNVSLEAYDLLHQLSKDRLVVNSQGRTEIHVNTIPSYFMLKFQYVL